MEIRKNQEYIVHVEGYNSHADGVARIDGRAVFIPMAVKGEVWRIKIIKCDSTSCYAKGLECLQTSDQRIRPECEYFGKCGGCDICHISYSEELNFKLSRVNDALKRIGGVNLSIDKIIGSDNIIRYRNKCIFNISNDGDTVRFGFYRERTHDLVPINSCPAQKEISEKVSRSVISFMNENRLKPYDEKSGKGTVRHIYCRSAVYTHDAVVCIVSARGFGGLTDELVNRLLYECPELTGIILCINKGRMNSVLAGEYHTLYGEPNITDYLGRFEFSVSPQAFYQVNPPQAEKLYAKAVEYASRGETDSCLELYCGSGTISLFLSEKFKSVFATEIVPEAICNAEDNAKRNGVENVTFMCGDAAETAEYALKNTMSFNCVLVDPPRKGMSEDTIKAIAKINPERLVYVSCDPATLSRDIQRIYEYGYEMIDGTAVDMFPRTCHVETVVLLSKKNSVDDI